MAISSRSVRRASVPLLRSDRNMRRAFAERLANWALMRRDMVPPFVDIEPSLVLQNVLLKALAEPLLRTPEARQASGRLGRTKRQLMPPCARRSGNILSRRWS